MDAHGKRRHKLTTMHLAARLVRSGTSLAFGGLLYQNKPVAFVHALVRCEVGGLHLMPPAASSYDVDLLVGAGLATAVSCPAVYFEDLGLAPRFRKAAETRTIAVWEVDEAAMIGGLLATLANAPYIPICSVDGSQVADESPQIVRIEDGEGGFWAARPIAPDVAVVHAQYGDVYGNVVHRGATYADVLLAKAARVTIVTVDEVETERALSSDDGITIPAHFVDAIVEAPEGALPCSSHGCYSADHPRLAEYVRLAAHDDEFAKYLTTLRDRPLP